MNNRRETEAKLYSKVKDNNHLIMKKLTISPWVTRCARDVFPHPQVYSVLIIKKKYSSQAVPISNIDIFRHMLNPYFLRLDIQLLEISNRKTKIKTSIYNGSSQKDYFLEAFFKSYSLITQYLPQYIYSGCLRLHENISAYYAPSLGIICLCNRQLRFHSNYLTLF